MSLSPDSLDVQPLLGALRDLVTIHQDALLPSTELVGALASGNLAAMQRAVAAQQAVAEMIDAAERRRRAAEAGVAHTLGAGRETITASELLTLLPPDEAARLRRVRHELLEALLRLQAVNRQAALLVRNAQAVITRAVSATAPRALSYGPRGELALPAGRAERRQPARRA